MGFRRMAGLYVSHNDHMAGTGNRPECLWKQDTHGDKINRRRFLAVVGYSGAGVPRDIQTLLERR